MSERFSRGWRWGTSGVLGCTAFAGVTYALAAAPAAPAPSGVVPENVSLAGVPVSGKTSDEVRKIADDLGARLLGYPLTLRYGKHTTSRTAGKLGGSVDAKTAVDAAFAPPPVAGNFFDRLRVRFSAPEHRDIPLPLVLTPEGISKGLARFTIAVGAESRNARLFHVGGKFKAVPPRPGKELDTTALATLIQSTLDAAELRARLADSLQQEPSSSKWLAAQKALEIAATTREAQPHIAVADLKPINSLLSSYNTSLGNSSRNRVHNIELACKAIDGTVLMPGDVFSYNDTVGPRVPSAGFREAPVIIRGQLEKGTGGGICQVSSTLYNAALLADLNIIRRSHHAFPVHYLPAGRDATVVDRAIDFRFKNTLEHPVALDAKIAGRRVTFRIWGNPADKKDVEISLSGISHIPAGQDTVSDPKLPKGKRVVERKAMTGHRVTVTRVVKAEGKVVKREVISRDYYRPFSAVVRVGTHVNEASTRAVALPGTAATPATTPAGQGKADPTANPTPGG